MEEQINSMSKAEDLQEGGLEGEQEVQTEQPQVEQPDAGEPQPQV